MGQFNCSKLRPGLVRLGQVSLDKVRWDGLGQVRSGLDVQKISLFSSGQVRSCQARLG